MQNDDIWKQQSEAFKQSSDRGSNGQANFGRSGLFEESAHDKIMRKLNAIESKLDKLLNHSGD